MNGSDQVSAVESEQGNVAMVLELSKSSTGSVAQIARTDMTEAGLRETSGASTRVNGLEAYVGTYEGVSGSTTVLLRVAHIRAAQRVYLVAGMTTATEFRGLMGGSRRRFRPSGNCHRPKPIAFSPIGSVSRWFGRVTRGSRLPARSRMGPA